MLYVSESSPTSLTTDGVRLSNLSSVSDYEQLQAGTVDDSNYDQLKPDYQNVAGV